MLTIKNEVLLINGLSALLVFFIVLIPDSPLRVILGVPFVLFFPGYTLMGSLFPAKQDLGGIERLSLSVGLSLAVVPLVGLALNYTPWGIRLYPVILSLFMLTLVLSVISNYRRSKLNIEQNMSLPIQIKMPQLSKMHKFDKLFIVSFIIAMILIGGLFVYIASAPKIGEPFTEFYVLGVNGELTNYPVNLTLGDKGVVIIGVTNHEYQTVNYTITVSLNNQTIQTIDNIRLSNEMNWTQNCNFTPKDSGKSSLDLTLYKEGSLEPYRTLKLWINVPPN
jgi:uncharacterized membrane protein